MRIALAQINTTVGDINGNTARMREAIHEAAHHAADILLFPELAVLGYLPRDLIFKEGVVARCEQAVADLARICGETRAEMLAILPSPRLNDFQTGTGVCNSAAICRGGEIVSWYDKRLLPTYDVFDESRYFDPGRAVCVIEHQGYQIGLTICEDLWRHDEMVSRARYEVDPVRDLAEARVDLTLNASASPFRKDIPAYRRKLFAEAVDRVGAPLAFTNLVGGNDDLVFDGHSALFMPQQGCAEQLPGFTEELCIVEAEAGKRAAGKTAAIPDGVDDLSEIYHALVLGTRDYLSKCGFREVFIAVSGGIDSALVATIAVGALGAKAVRGVTLPSRYSSEGSVTDAEDLAANLGIRLDTIAIEEIHKTMESSLRRLFEESNAPPGIAEENIQARIRGNLMMALSNKFGALLLTTGNKSEVAVGYCTLYGDMAGGLAVISDVPKTMVYAMSRWINANHESLGFRTAPIPESTITKPPSAELKPDQVDQDTLPPYDVLDEIIYRHVEHSESVPKIVERTGFETALVERICRLIDRNEYKRQQMPTGLKVTGRAFGSGWRMPIAARFP